MKNTWDSYFYSHYHLGKSLGQKDIDMYTQWYYSWIQYIRTRTDVLNTKRRIFEIGSGIGAVTRLLHDNGHDIIGSDISHEAVEAAKKLCPFVRFIQCDIQKPIPIQKMFDIIMGFEVLEHIPNFNSAVSNIAHSLKRGGVFIGTTPFPYPKNNLDPTHVCVQHPDRWKIIFLQNGFVDVRILPMSFLPFLWKIHKHLNLVLPLYISVPYIVSTSLIFARKHD